MSFSRARGGTYLILIDEGDERFFQLVFPGFWAIESETERQKVNGASLFATAKTKVAKVFPVNDNTWASIELFCATPDAFQPVFERCLSALRAAVQNFVDKMKE